MIKNQILRGRPALEKTVLRSSVSALIMTSLMAAGGANAAQTSAPNQEGDEDGSNIDEIVVHGSKNSNSYMDTLASLGLVTAEDIAEKELRSFREAFRILGNVSDTPFADGGFVLRGINSEGLVPGSVPLAGLYVDGAQQSTGGARRGARGLWDVEQLEVYRGPQSTLSGRASLAGAIYIKTKDPTFDWDAAARVTVGNFKTREGAIAVGGPIIEDQVAFRFAAEHSLSKNTNINYPTYERFLRFDDFTEDEYYQLRGKVLVTPTSMPDTRFLLSYSFSHDSPNSRSVGGPNNGFSYNERRGDFTTAGASGREVRSSNVHNVSLEVTHEFSDDLILTSNTTMSDAHTRRPSLNAGTPGETRYSDGFQNQALYTQELRLNYESGPWKNVIGLYANYEDGNFKTVDTSEPLPDITIASGEDTLNLAIFGESVYEFRPGWKVVTGGRIDYVDAEETQFAKAFNVVVLDKKPSTHELVFLPKLGLVKEIGDDHTLSFVVQKGFRSGGVGVYVAGAGFPPPILSYAYDAEFTWNYEASYKGTYADGRGTLSANAFYTDWTDQQVEVDLLPDIDNSSFVENAASSRLYGAELETRFSVTDDLSLFGSLGYLDTQFENFQIGQLDVSGRPFPNSPERTVAMGGNYEHPSGFFVGGDAKYTYEQLSQIGSTIPVTLDSRTIVNAQLGYRADRYDISFFVENLFDKEYFTFQSYGGNPRMPSSAVFGQRRFYGASLTFRY